MLWQSFFSVNFVNVRLNRRFYSPILLLIVVIELRNGTTLVNDMNVVKSRSGLVDQRYRFTVNDTDTIGTVSPVPVPVSYRFVSTVCNPTKLFMCDNLITFLVHHRQMTSK